MTRPSSPVRRFAPAADLALAEHLHSAALRFMRRVRQVDRERPVGPARLSALSVLVFSGPQTPGRLAAFEHVRRPTMSRVVDGLERLGLARREPDPDDGRGVRIRATRLGIRTMLRGRRRRVEAIARRLEGVPASKRAVLAEAATLMLEMAGSED